MSLELTGKLLVKYDEVIVSATFKKREFVVELAQEVNGNTYTNYAKMQLTQAKCDLIKDLNVGDNVKVQFNIKGNKYVKDGKDNYISNLEAWRIEKAEGQAPQQQAPQSNYQAPQQQAQSWQASAPQEETGLPF